MQSGPSTAAVWFLALVLRRPSLLRTASVPSAKALSRCLDDELLAVALRRWGAAAGGRLPAGARKSWVAIFTVVTSASWWLCNYLWFLMICVWAAAAVRSAVMMIPDTIKVTAQWRLGTHESFFSFPSQALMLGVMIIFYWPPRYILRRGTTFFPSLKNWVYRRAVSNLITFVVVCFALMLMVMAKLWPWTVLVFAVIDGIAYGGGMLVVISWLLWNAVRNPKVWHVRVEDRVFRVVRLLGTFRPSRRHGAPPRIRDTTPNYTRLNRSALMLGSFAAVAIGVALRGVAGVIFGALGFGTAILVS